MAERDHGAQTNLVEPAFELGGEEAAQFRSRALIAERLAEIVTWPATRIAPHERQLAGDILIGLLRTADTPLRKRCASRMAMIVDAPKAVLRYLARDQIDVAEPLLEASPGLDDSDLIATIRAGTPAHWAAIARRRNLTETVTEALIQAGDPAIIAAMLRNPFTKLSAPGVDMIVAQSRQHRGLCPAILTREEIKPAQGLTLFWWADGDARLHILRRFAVDRSVLLQEVSDLFVLASREQWTDRDARAALQFIERRQRSRSAAERSTYSSLENAVLSLVEKGPSRDLLIEIGHLAGIRPAIGARILSDAGGEPLAVLAKSVGLKRDMLLTFWRGLKRPESEDPKSAFQRTLYVFDTLATAKAQTVLRYWNWSLSSDAPSGIGELDPGDETLEFAPARRTAALVLGWRGA
jgi:uncharacterized protein (DUF2336 family)